ncbi:ATP-binding protein, partial [Pseudoalteromonas sp. S201]
MIETINQQLQLLKLSGIKQALKQQLEQPNLYQEQSFIERVSLLLTHEIDTRD